MTVRILTYGGIVQAVEVPDRDGRLANVALGFADLAAYLENNRPYFGTLIGRYANRIAGGVFTLDGTTYHFPVNEPPNSLHGGTEGFDKRLWAAAPVADADEQLGFGLGDDHKLMLDRPPSGQALAPAARVATDLNPFGERRAGLDDQYHRALRADAATPGRRPVSARRGGLGALC